MSTCYLTQRPRASPSDLRTTTTLAIVAGTGYIRSTLGTYVNVQAVIDRIDRILVEQFELDPARVIPSASLQADLEFDSLDGLDLVVALEKDFGFRVDDRAMMEMKTVGDIHDYVRMIHGRMGQQEEAQVDRAL